MTMDRGSGTRDEDVIDARQVHGKRKGEGAHLEVLLQHAEPRDEEEARGEQRSVPVSESGRQSTSLKRPLADTLCTSMSICVGAS